MLILTRRMGESVIIGDEVVITVLNMKTNQARIGIEAPNEVDINRDEYSKNEKKNKKREKKD